MIKYFSLSPEVMTGGCFHLLIESLSLTGLLCPIFPEFVVSGILIVYLKLQYFVENAHFQIENNFYPLQSEQASLLPLQLHLVPKVIEINILDVEQQSKQKKTMLEIGGCMLSGKMPHWTSDDPEICSIIINSLIQRT